MSVTIFNKIHEYLDIDKIHINWNHRLTLNCMLPNTVLWNVTICTIFIHCEALNLFSLLYGLSY